MKRKRVNDAQDALTHHNVAHCNEQHSHEQPVLKSPTKSARLSPQFDHKQLRDIATGPYGHYALNLQDVYTHLFPSPSSSQGDQSPLIQKNYFSKNVESLHSGGGTIHHPQLMGARKLTYDDSITDRSDHILDSAFKHLGLKPSTLHTLSTPSNTDSNSITIRFRGKAHSFDPRDSHLGATQVPLETLKTHLSKCSTHLSKDDNIGVRLKSKLSQLPTDHYQLIVRRGYAERQYLTFLHPLRMTDVAKKRSHRVAECAICRVPMYHTDESFRNAEEQHVHMKIHVQNCRKLALSQEDLSRYKRIISESREKAEKKCEMREAAVEVVKEEPKQEIKSEKVKVKCETKDLKMQPPQKPSTTAQPTAKAQTKPISSPDARKNRSRHRIKKKKKRRRKKTKLQL